MPEDKCWCGRDVYENGKCIFHCEKRDWYVEDDKGNRDWSKSEEKCKKFWVMFEEKFKKDIKYHDFTWFVFPRVIEPFEKRSFTKALIFKNCFFEDEVKFNECNFTEKIDFDGSDVKGSIFFEGCKFDKNVYLGVFNVEDPFKDRKKFGGIEFSNPSFKDKVSVFIENIQVDSLKLAYFTNSAKIFRLTDVCVNSELSFYHSNLAGIEFNNFDVSKAEEISLENASFLGSNGNAIFNGVNWGKNLFYRLRGSTRDTLRQLKHVNDLQGNIIDANVFYSLEMKKYNLEEKHHSSQGIVFLINKFVSDFSQNWILPIYWYLVLGVIFFKLQEGLNYAIRNPKVIFELNKSISMVGIILILFLFPLVFLFLKSKIKKEYMLSIIIVIIALLFSFLVYKFLIIFWIMLEIRAFFVTIFLIAIAFFFYDYYVYNGYRNLNNIKKIEKIFYKLSINFIFLSMGILAIGLFLYFILNEKNFLNFINPFNTDIEKIGSGKIVKFSFILFKLISVFLGYQLITSLRHYTRRK